MVIIKSQMSIVGIDASYQDMIKKSVYQIDKFGNVVAEYDSIYEAEQITKIRHIYECVNNKRKTAGGYAWVIKERYNG